MATTSTPLPATALYSSSSVSRRPPSLLRISAASPSMATSTKVLPAAIVGGGRVGRALLGMGGAGQDLLLGRGDAVPADFEGPIFVCTRNDDLDAVLQSTPRPRWSGTSTFVCVKFQPLWL